MSEPPLRSALRDQARALATIRSFFAERDVVEVSTPAINPAGATDPALGNVSCELSARGGRHYLQTSPEHAMKRLLAAGSGDIWQIARVFRDGELGRWHRPEFLLLEWYRTGFDELALMDEVFELLATMAAASGRELDRLDLSYADAFANRFGIDPHRFEAAGESELERQLEAQGVEVPDAVSADALLDLALCTAIVPAWPRDTAVFLFDYPASQAALAALKPGQPPLAARFEVFIDGVELGNGYRELTDAGEQRRRFEADLAMRRRRGLPEVPIDEALLAALASGLPACSGVAVGVDRLLAVLSGAKALADGVDGPPRD